MDVSWVHSARLRATAAQMAQRVAAPLAESWRTDSTDPLPPNPDAPSHSRRDAASNRSSPPSDFYLRQSDERVAAEPARPADGAAATESTAEDVERPAPVLPKVRLDPVRALRRLFSKIPGGWSAGAGVVASTLRKAPSPATPPAPDLPPRGDLAPNSEDQTIAEELGLRADLAIDELRRIRREFAKKNHPDRFEAAQRHGAARRMTIANMLIDSHLKQRPPTP